MGDETKLSEFFNELELNEDISDLMLLVEAERRGLLDDTCAMLLAEARKRGWVAPKVEIESPAVFDVRYLGSSKISDDTHVPTSEEVAGALTRLMSNPRQNFQAHVDMSIRVEGITVEDYNEAYAHGSQDKPTTLRRIKDATLNILRRSSVSKPEALKPEQRPEPILVVRHAMREIKTFMIFDKVFACIVQEKDYLTGKDAVNCHAYKCKDHKRAEEIGAELRKKSLAMKHQQQHIRANSNTPVIDVKLRRSKMGFGLGVIGPATKSEVSAGVFISSIAEGSPAASCPDICVGMQIMSLNGTSLEEVTMAECRSLLMNAGDEIHIRIRENAYDYAMYQKKMGKMKPIVKFHGTKTTGELEEIISDILEDMLVLSKNTVFTDSVRIVGGKAQFTF